MTSLDEAIPLREAGVGANILLMTGFWRGEESEIVRLHLTPTVWELSQIESLDKAAAGLGVAQHPVHLKIDSGMGRLGVAVEQLPGLLKGLRAAKHLAVEGLSTHLASSEIMSRSLPTASMRLRISSRPSEIVTSETGCVSSPFSMRKPDAPRLKSPVTALKPCPIMPRIDS